MTKPKYLLDYMLPKKKIPGYNLFLHTKPVKLIVNLAEGPKYATILSKEIDCTYSHTVKLLDQFKKFGLVEFEKRGRIKVVTLTSPGESIAHSFKAAMTLLKRLK